jgi:hypothetical protein
MRAKRLDVSYPLLDGSADFLHRLQLRVNCKKSGTEPARLANRIDRKIKPLDTKPETVPAPWGKEIGDRPRAVG